MRARAPESSSPAKVVVLGKAPLNAVGDAEGLSPAIQDGEKAYLRSEMLGLDRDGSHRFSRGLEEDAVGHLLVLVGDSSKPKRHFSPEEFREVPFRIRFQY